MSTKSIEISQGNLPLLIERLCERFIEQTFPIAKVHLMPRIREEISQLDREGRLEVSDNIKLVGGIVWDVVRKYLGR